ncbi:MAG: Ig-like domain-containing protein, partial [Planctomycetota bacterium]
MICLQSCNLGCSTTGCSRSDIAQNQIIILQFSDAIDPATVSPSSIRFRTATGEQPVGEFFVNGNQVEFVPTLSISGGQTFFGFSAGETYTMTIPAGDTELAVVRSTSGKPFGKELTCSLASTLGIVDLNQIAPRATLLVPTADQLTAAPRDTEIVLEFNEMIDATPFLSTSQTPVTFSVRRNRLAAGGGYECDPNSNSQTLTGTQRLDFDAGRGVSTLSFQPAQQLPGNICVEVNVTDGVTDLSGRPAQPQTFTFRTIVVPLTETNTTEEFDNAQQLDADASAATWANGVASFARIGGDGRHGVFSTSLAIDTQTIVGGKNVYQFNTDNTVIPASNTTTGAAIAITDGRFYFSTMIVPSNVLLRFVGSRPPILTVAGRFEVLGDIDVSGGTIGLMPLSTAVAGQPGGSGGIFGGNGGRGGDKVSSLQATTTGATAANNGVNGDDARLLGGHGYAAGAAGSGGRGSTVFPASGRNVDIYFGANSGAIYSPTAAAGGGGAGFTAPGALGRVVTNNHSDTAFAGTATSATATTLVAAPLPAWLPARFAGRTVTIDTGAGAGQSRTVVSSTTTTLVVTPAWDTLPAAGSTFSIPAQPVPMTGQMGPSAAGGSAVQILPFPAGTGTITKASEHFLIGGAGGGGGASHACLGLFLLTDRWVAGAGGGGGGGALALRAG